MTYQGGNDEYAREKVLKTLFFYVIISNMENYKSYYKKEYNNNKSFDLANTLSLLLTGDEVNPLSDNYTELVNLAKRVDRAVIYCPLSLAEWILVNNAGVYNKLCELSHVQVKAVALPKKYENISLLNMFAARALSRREVKNRITVDTVFDCLQKAQKKNLVVTSVPKLEKQLSNKYVDVIKVPNGMEAVNKAVSAIKSGDYHLIIVVDRDYEDCIGLTRPYSKSGLVALEKVMQKYELINDAVDVYYKCDCLVGMCPDKGCSVRLFHSATSAIGIADSNVEYFFTIKTH